MPPPHTLLLATGNPHKAGEIESILVSLLPGGPIRFLTTADFPDAREPEETGATFEENALLKARFYARRTGRLALADDSGLVVDALGGRPGIHSARFAPTAAERLRRVLDELGDAPRERRTARFLCVASLADPGGGECTAEGTVEGWITAAPAGSAGFGYDPIFEPLLEGHPARRTLAQLSPEKKNAISHRGRALRALAPRLAASLAIGRVSLA